MNLQPTLEDHHIILRPLDENDFNPLYEVARDPLIWHQHPSQNRYKRNVYAAFFADSLESKGALVVIDKRFNKVIGSSRFEPVKQVDNAIEIGWSFLARKYWGGHYNRCMKTLMMDHAFKFVEDVVFFIDVENIRSQKSVEKLGAYQIASSHFDTLPIDSGNRQITTSPHHQLIKSGSRDLTYRINRRDWILQRQPRPLT